MSNTVTKKAGYIFNSAIRLHIRILFAVHYLHISECDSDLEMLYAIKKFRRTHRKKGPKLSDEFMQPRFASKSTTENGNIKSMSSLGPRL